MTLLSDWLRKHFGAKPTQAPLIPVPAAAEAVLSRLASTIVDSFAPLQRIGVSVLMVHTDCNGDLGALYGSPITPKALRVMAQWADKTLAAMPNPEVH